MPEVESLSSAGEAPEGARNREKRVQNPMSGPGGSSKGKDWEREGGRRGRVGDFGLQTTMMGMQTDIFGECFLLKGES